MNVRAERVVRQLSERRIDSFVAASSLRTVKPPTTLNGQELELFRVGNYGDKGTYTHSDLQDLVQRYSNGQHDEAAITAGHPKKDSEPAFGWVKSLRVSDGVLFGTAGEVNPDFDKAVVVNKAYKHRSAGFSRDRAGKLSLRHVAFLGAVPPAVTGLRPTTFSSDPYQEFAFSEGDVMPDEELKKSIGEGIRAFFSDLVNPKTAPAVVDEAALTERVTKTLEAKFSADLEAEKAERLALQKKFDAQQIEFSATTVADRAAKAIAGVKAAGAWVPAYDKVGVPQLFSALAVSEEIITFSEPDANDKTKTIEVKRDLVAAFSEVLKSVGQIVPKDRLTVRASTETSKALPTANGADVDPESVVFSEQVQKFSEENKVPFTVAYQMLVSQGKKPAPGAAAAGAV